MPALRGPRRVRWGTAGVCIRLAAPAGREPITPWEGAERLGPAPAAGGHAHARGGARRDYRQTEGAGAGTETARAGSEINTAT